MVYLEEIMTARDVTMLWQTLQAYINANTSSCLFSSVVPCGNIPGVCKTCLDGCWHWVINTWMDAYGWSGWTLCIGWIDCRILVRRPDTLPLPVDAVTLSLFPKFMFHSTVRLPRRGNTRKDPSTPTSPPQTTSLVSDFLWVVFFLVQLYYVIIWLIRNHVLLTKYCLQSLNSFLLIDWWGCNSS